MEKDAEEDRVDILHRHGSYFIPPEDDVIHVDETKASISNPVELAFSLMKEDTSAFDIDAMIDNFTLCIEQRGRNSVHIPIPNEKIFWKMVEDAYIVTFFENKGDVVFFAVYLSLREERPTKGYYYIFKSNRCVEIIEKLLDKTNLILAKGEDDLKKLKIPGILRQILSIRAKYRFPKEREKKFTEREAKLNFNIWKQRKAAELWEERKKRGLINSTTRVESGDCITCNSLDNLRTISTTMTGIKFSLLFTMCPSCIEESKKSPSLLLFIYDKMGEKIGEKSSATAPKFKRLDNLEYIKLAKEELKKLSHIIDITEKATDSKHELHISMINNCKLILRMSSPNDYAYIFLRNGKEELKWDSANHHELKFGPDHIHGENIQSSLLFGNVFLDLDTINNTIKPYIKGIK